MYIVHLLPLKYKRIKKIWRFVLAPLLRRRFKYFVRLCWSNLEIPFTTNCIHRQSLPGEGGKTYQEMEYIDKSQRHARRWTSLSFSFTIIASTLKTITDTTTTVTRDNYLITANLNMNQVTDVAILTHWRQRLKVI